MGELRLYFRYIQMHWKAGLQYKGWWMMLLQTIFIVVTDPIGTLLLFNRFGSIGEWSAEKILLVYIIAVTSFGLAETFFRGFDYFPWKMVQGGEFDRLMLRPRSLVTQSAASFFHIHRLGRSLSGMIVIFVLLSRLGIRFTLLNVLILAFALLGGFLLYAGVFIISSGISFFTVKNLEWTVIFTNFSYQVARCPVEYLPRLLRNCFTFIMPMLVISYYPASVICGWGSPVWQGFLSLPAGLLFFAASLIIWKIGVSKYKSTGS